MYVLSHKQGSRDDLSTATASQSQSAIKHATSADTSFSKDVLNSIAGNVGALVTKKNFLKSMQLMLQRVIYGKVN